MGIEATNVANRIKRKQETVKTLQAMLDGGVLRRSKTDDLTVENYLKG